MILIRHFLKFILLLNSLYFLSGCQQNAQSYQPEYATNPEIKTNKVYVLGIHPLNNPKRLYENFTPLIEYLERHLPNTHFKIEASKDYPSYDLKIRYEVFDFLLPNPYQTTIAVNYDYKVINQMGANNVFKGIILVRKDSDINEISDLKGKNIAYPAPTALAATMMPQYFLQTHGLDLKTETTTHYVGSQESSIMNVYMKKTAASATWPVPWFELQKKQPEIANQLKVAWETDTLPSNSFMYHTKKVPEELALKVQKLLSELENSEEGVAVLGSMNIKHVLIANNQTYQPVIDFTNKFQQIIGDNSLLEKAK